MSFELFRRIATDAITTPDLLPDRPAPRPTAAGPVTRGLCDTGGRDRRRSVDPGSGAVPGARLHGRRPGPPDRRPAPRPVRPPDPRRRRRLAAGASPASCSSPCPASAPTATPTSPTRSPGGAAALVVDAARSRDPSRARRRDGRPRRRSARRARARSPPAGAAGSTRSSSASPAASPRPRPRRPSRPSSAGRFRTLRNEGNQNNEIGLPLTLLRLGPEHEAAVLEMGMYVGGEIADLARIARPRIGVVTAVQPVHLSRIGSLEAIEAAKGELVEALPRRRRGAILNADDPIVRRMGARTRGARDRPTGSPPTPTSRAEAVELGRARRDALHACAPTGARRPRGDPDARPAVGPQRARGGRGRARGRPVARRDRRRPRRPAGRRRIGSQLVRLGAVTLVDDTYNASPRSVRRGARAAGRAARPAGRGPRRDARARRRHDDGHRAVGEAAARTRRLARRRRPGCRRDRRRGPRRGLDPARDPPRRATPSRARDAVLPRLRDGDVVLVKASRGIGLDASSTASGRARRAAPTR